MDPSRPLKNARHELFCQHRAAGLSADAAYTKAGYSPDRHNAAKLTTNNPVAERLEYLEEMNARAASVSVAFVVEGLVKNYHRAMRLEKVYDRKGEPTGELTYNGPVANKALELLGKHLGMFVPVEAGSPAPEAADPVTKELLRKIGVKDIADARAKRTG